MKATLVSTAVTAALAAAALALCSCGQKGPLVLPTQPPATQRGTAPNRSPSQGPGTQTTRPSGQDTSGTGASGGRTSG
jgi:predicted small lipoprotein YifL